MYCGCENGIIFSHKKITSSLLLMYSQHSSDTQIMWIEMVTNQKKINNRLAWPFVNWKWNQGCSEWFLPPSNELLLPIGVVSFSFIRGSLNAFEYACDYSHMLWPLQITRSQLKSTPGGPTCLCSPPLLSKHQMKVSLKYTFKYLENQCRGAWRSNSLIRCFMLFFFFNFHFITL